MRTIVFSVLIAAVLPLSLFSAEAEDRAEDRAAIRRAALDYIEGWYAKDPERMERALHYDAIKRRVQVDKGSSSLDAGGALRLVQATRPVPGRIVPPLKDQRRDITILDLYGNAASVKVDATSWVDYLHMVKWNNEWRILNILWELRPEK